MSAHDVLRGQGRRLLDAVFSPKSVAVIGASDRPGSVGGAVMRNLSAFPGVVHAVNPKRDTVGGKPCYPTIGAVPGKVDLAVILTPAPSVPALVRECGEAGVRAAVVISAGFRETGAEGAELERQVLEEARRHSMRIIGPNCLGVMAPHAGLNATFAASLALPGEVAFISQSGALCTAILGWSLRERVGFSAFVSVGSMLDVGWGDLIYHLGDDPRTRSIVIYMESVGDARSFLSAAREVALSKPIVVIKVGRTEAAAKAAASHTGSLTGSDDVLDAAFQRVGVLRVDRIAELFAMAQVLAKQPRPLGPRLAIVTNAGGPGALAVDVLTASGGKIAPIGPDTMSALNGLLPAPWSHGDPIDVLGDAGPERYAGAIELAAREPESDGVLAILTPQAMTEPVAIAESLKSAMGSSAKPLLASWMGGDEVEAGRKILRQAGIPTFDYPDTAARAFSYLWRYADNLRSLYETPALLSPEEAGTKSEARASALIAKARRAGRTLLSEQESKEIFDAYGIPTVKTLIARTAEAAVAHASKLGFPVAVKLHSHTVTHKAEVGGVKLGVRDAAGVRKAWNAIQKSVGEKAGPGHFLGVTVQQMVPLDGVELILGSSVDPQFGPVVLFGAGGRLVEVMHDRAVGLPPLNSTLARRLMSGTRIYAALGGGGKRPPLDVEGLAALLVRFSRMIAQERWIKESDINPLLIGPSGLLALDARIVLHPPETPESALPRLAIRPYPSQYIKAWKLRGGPRVTLRPIRPEDEPLMVNFHRTLSERSVYMRYFEPLRVEARIAHERLARICFIDYDREMALVAELETGEGRQILGVGRLSKVHGSASAEFAILVSDLFQGKGLGRQFLNLLIKIGRDEKLDRIFATMLGDNIEMRRLCESAGLTVERQDGGDCEAWIEL